MRFDPIMMMLEMKKDRRQYNEETKDREQIINQMDKKRRRERK